ncbi:MAG: BMC domain-containing protein [Deltaproteobacteria bacterium]|nr:BMC domain-containing protein [Deltaproteobacteria bacterium]
MIKNLDQPAIGMIELSSIARGFYICDAMVKKAPIEVLMSQTTSPGKYLILICGDVASVEASTQHGKELSDKDLIDSLFIPNIHHAIIPAVSGHYPKVSLEAVGIVETVSVASAIVSADAALKTAEVHLMELQLGKGLGGKGYFVVTGDLSEVQAALDQAEALLMPNSKLLKKEVIASPHEEFSLRVSP